MLLSLAGIWIIIVFIDFTNPKNQPSNKELLPKDIELVMTLNTQEVIHTFLYDLLFQSNLDENTAQLFTIKDRKALNKLGININSEVVLFYDNWKNESARGVLVDISNEGDFKRYPTDKGNTIKKSNSKYGILLYLDEKATQESVEHFSKLAENIINKKIKTEKNQQAKSMIDFQYTGSKDAYLNHLDLDLDIKNREVHIEGRAKLNTKEVNQKSKLHSLIQTKNRDCFEIETSKIPREAMNYLSSAFYEIGIRIPKIQSMQMLVYGVTIDNFDRSMAILPSFDCILRFEETFSIDSAINQMNSNYRTLIDSEQKTISIGSVKYHYKQISGKEIYIGEKVKPNYSLTTSTPVYSVSGNPSALLEIEGQGFIAGFIKVLPPVKYSKQFLNELSDFDITATQVDESLKIKGIIRVKEDRLMSVELMKLWLLLF